MAKFIDLTSQTLSDLTVIKDSGKRDNHKVILWECQCSCGNITLVRGNDLKLNRIKSCGCKRSQEQSKSGTEHMAELLDRNIKEGTHLGQLNAKLSSRNKSGIKGVCWVTKFQKWKATIMFQGKAHYLGMYNNIEDAAKARKDAEEKYFKPILEKYGKEFEKMQ